MGLEEFSPFAPVRLKALLLPVGRIKRSRFITFVNRLLPENIVRLGDISPDARSDRTMFSPLASPDGRLIYDFSTSLSSSRHSAIEPDKLLPEALLLIGIADSKEYEGLTGTYYGPDSDDETGQDPQVVRDIESVHEAMNGVQGSFQHVLCHALLLFDCSPSIALQPLPEHTFLVPPIENSKTTTVKTVLCDLTAAFLSDLSLLGRAILARHPLDVPRSGRNRSHRHSDPPSAAYAATLSSTTRRPILNSASTASAADLQRNRHQLPPGSLERAHTPLSIARRSEPSYPSTDTSQRTLTILETMPFSEVDPKRRPGRISVVIGTLFLAAGRWHDALAHLAKGAVHARAAEYHLFHGKALEHLLICILLLALFEQKFEVPQNLFIPAEQAAEQAEAQTISSFNWNADTSSEAFGNLKARIFAGQNIVLHSYRRVPIKGLYHDKCCMRFCFLRTALLGVDTLNQLDPVDLIRGSSIPLVARATGILPPIRNGAPGRLDIAELLLNATEHPDAKLRLRTIQSSTSSGQKLLEELELIEHDATFLAASVLVLRSLQMGRREAFALAEFFRLERSVVERLSEISNTHAGRHFTQHDNSDSQDQSSLTPAQEDDLLGVSRIVASFVDLEGAMGTVHLMNSAAEKFLRGDHRSNEQCLQEALMTWRTYGLGNQNVVHDINKVCVRLFEECDNLWGMARVLEAIREHEARMQDTPPATLYHYSSLDEEEFRHLWHDLRQTRLDLQRLTGDGDYEADYWDELLVCSLEHHKGPSSCTNLTRLSFSDAEDSAPGSQYDIVNVVIHSSLKIAADTAEADALAAGQHTQFLISLRNPNAVELVVDCIDVVTEGVNFGINRDAMQDSWTLKPHSLQTLVIVGMAEGPGVMKITGCNVKIRGYRGREFPIFSDIGTPESFLDKPRTTWEDRMLFRGLARREKDERSDFERLPVPEIKTFRVIGKQPVVTLAARSLQTAAVMSMEGERKIVWLEMKNVSDVRANFLRFEVNDNTVREYQASISRGGVSEQALHELAWWQVYAKGLEVRDNHTIAAAGLEPGATKALAVKVYGKPGLTRGSITLFYANIPAPVEPRHGVYVRQATFDFDISVLPSVQLLRSVDGLLNSAQRHCLIGLQFMNHVKNDVKLSITVDCKSDGSTDGDGPQSQTLHHDVAPGTSVFPVSVPPLYVGDPYRPVPLAKKQFVVRAIAEDAVKAQLKSFWIRQALLGALRGRWTDVVTGREGDINFRRLRLRAGCEEALAALAVFDV